jgi:hypothetical protein
MTTFLINTIYDAWWALSVPPPTKTVSGARIDRAAARSSWPNIDGFQCSNSPVAEGPGSAAVCGASRKNVGTRCERGNSSVGTYRRRPLQGGGIEEKGVQTKLISCLTTSLSRQR